MTATSNIALKVPFKEKDEAKSLGARWNPDGKHWYVPEGVDASPFAKWIDGDTLTIHLSEHKTPTEPNNALPASLSANADLVDINAMLRDAYEPNDVEPM
ncbi:MAG: DUF5710 domain-containing protein [Methylophilaceae bacterium]|nr:DUF5710 domain-containing protein [Methylophilaceae bacterium]